MEKYSRNARNRQRVHDGGIVGRAKTYLLPGRTSPAWKYTVILCTANYFYLRNHSPSPREQIWFNVRWVNLENIVTDMWRCSAVGGCLSKMLTSLNDFVIWTCFGVGLTWENHLWGGKCCLFRLNNRFVSRCLWQLSKLFFFVIIIKLRRCYIK